MEVKQMAYASKLADAMIECVKENVGEFLENSGEMDEFLKTVNALFGVKLIPILTENDEVKEIAEEDTETKEVLSLLKNIFNI